jgi:hypothetical protein
LYLQPQITTNRPPNSNKLPISTRTINDIEGDEFQQQTGRLCKCKCCLKNVKCPLRYTECTQARLKCVTPTEFDGMVWYGIVQSKQEVKEETSKHDWGRRPLVFQRRRYYYADDLVKRRRNVGLLRDDKDMAKLVYRVQRHHQ